METVNTEPGEQQQHGPEIDDALWQKCLAAATRGRLPGHDGEYLMTAEEHAALLYLLHDSLALRPGTPGVPVGESPLGV